MAAALHEIKVMYGSVGASIFILPVQTVLNRQSVAAAQRAMPAHLLRRPISSSDFLGILSEVSGSCLVTCHLATVPYSEHMS
ncbi:hypothetical protein LZ32DRAFT_603676 [Colletotrichum eremochloae]|nr:hypothetical protein LZ32DRAFT_603676 [Colletotrichum eremochloae]